MDRKIIRIEVHIDDDRDVDDLTNFVLPHFGGTVGTYLQGKGIIVKSTDMYIVAVPDPSLGGRQGSLFTGSKA